MEISATRQDPLPAPRNPVADIVRLTKIWSHLKSHNSQPYLSRHLNLSTVEDVLRKKMVLLNLEDIAHSKDGDATQKEKALDDFERLAEAHATIFQCVNRTCFILKDAVGHRLDILDSLWENKSYNERFELVERLATLILKLPHFEERVSKMIDEQLIALAASDPNDEICPADVLAMSGRGDGTPQKEDEISESKDRVVVPNSENTKLQEGL